MNPREPAAQARDCTVLARAAGSWIGLPAMPAIVLFRLAVLSFLPLGSGSFFLWLKYADKALISTFPKRLQAAGV